LLVGLKIVALVAKAFSRRLETAEMDPSLRPFLTALVKVGLQILLVISVASMIGIEMTSFIAVIGAMAFAVGLALQGSLANFAGGVLILLLKPFQVGDYIEAAGVAGTVKEIQVFYTHLDTPDNKRIIVPNASMSNASTVNYNTNPVRRVDFTFEVGYGDDLDRVRAVLLEIAENHPLTFEDPPPQVIVGGHGENAIIVYLRMWSKKEDYWTIYFELMEKVKKAFDEAGINIPYPQRDVRLIGNEKKGEA